LVHHTIYGDLFFQKELKEVARNIIIDFIFQRKYPAAGMKNPCSQRSGILAGATFAPAVEFIYE
jgi:hypothetical protein